MKMQLNAAYTFCEESSAGSMTQCWLRSNDGTEYFVGFFSDPDLTLISYHQQDGSHRTNEETRFHLSNNRGNFHGRFD